MDKYNISEEVWKDIKDYEGLYRVSNFGRIYSTRNRIIMKQKEIKGYMMVGLSCGGKQKTLTVSRLVASAFVDNPFNKPEVNHIDEDKNNNRFDNLEWVTPKENSNHGTRWERIVKSNPDIIKGGREFLKNSKAVSIHDKDTHEILGKYKSINDACRALGVKPNGGITKACRDYEKVSCGYRWKYID